MIKSMTHYKRESGIDAEISIIEEIQIIEVLHVKGLKERAKKRLKKLEDFLSSNNSAVRLEFLFDIRLKLKEICDSLNSSFNHQDYLNIIRKMFDYSSIEDEKYLNAVFGYIFDFSNSLVPLPLLKEIIHKSKENTHIIKPLTRSVLEVIEDKLIDTDIKKKLVEEFVFLDTLSSDLKKSQTDISYSYIELLVSQRNFEDAILFYAQLRSDLKDIRVVSLIAPLWKVVLAGDNKINAILLSELINSIDLQSLGEKDLVYYLKILSSYTRLSPLIKDNYLDCFYKSLHHFKNSFYLTDELLFSCLVNFHHLTKSDRKQFLIDIDSLDIFCDHASHHGMVSGSICLLYDTYDCCEDFLKTLYYFLDKLENLNLFFVLRPFFTIPLCYRNYVIEKVVEKYSLNNDDAKSIINFFSNKTRKDFQSKSNLLDMGNVYLTALKSPNNKFYRNFINRIENKLKT